MATTIHCRATPAHGSAGPAAAAPAHRPRNDGGRVGRRCRLTRAARTLWGNAWPAGATGTVVWDAGDMVEVRLDEPGWGAFLLAHLGYDPATRRLACGMRLDHAEFLLRVNDPALLALTEEEAHDGV